MKFLSRLDDFEHIVIDGSVSGTGLSSLYLKDTATPILRIGNNTGDAFITYDGSELSISSDVDLRFTTPTDQDVFLITSSGNISTTAAGGIFTIGGGLTLPAITGGFLKTDANGVVSVDNSSFLTNETDTLDSVTDRGNTTTNNITVGNFTANGNITTNTGVFYSGNSTKLDLNQYNAGYLRLLTDNTERVRVTATGNVGIGTTNPGEKFVVANSSTQYLSYNSNGNLELYTPENASGYVRIGAAYLLNGIYGSEGLNYIIEPAYSHTFRSQSSALMTITGGGNVGIGTTAPNALLSISKTISSDTRFLEINNAGNNQFRSDIDFTVTSGGITVGRISSIYPAGNNVGLSFSTYGTSPSTGLHERMRINGSNGNVGIGTTDPGLLLEVNSNSTSAEMIRARYNASYYTDYGSNNMNFTGPSQTYQFRNNGSAAITINSSSNVGIGTTSPSTKLHISGGTDASVIRLENTSTSLSLGDTIGAVQFYNNDPTDDSANIAASIYAVAGPSGGSGQLRFKTTQVGTEGAAAGDTMTLTQGGNVGIGTTSPTQKLTVEDTIGIKRSGVAAVATIQQTGAGTEINAPSGYHPLIIKHNGSELARFKNDGNVGIGTTSPTHLLTLETASSPGIKIKDTTQGNTLLLFSQDSDSHIGTYSSHPLVFDTNSTERMRITSAGNVGIGTTSPDYKLDIDYVDTSISSNPTLRIRNAWTGEGNNIGFSNKSLVIVSAGNDTVVTKVQSRYDSGANIGQVGTTTNHDFLITTNNLERLRLDTSGNLKLPAYGAGILTTDASGNVSVDTSAYLTSYTETQTLDDVTTLGATTTNNISVGTLTASGGGNTVVLKKGTGNPALAFAGTSDEASALIEGISGGGLKVYTSNGGTLSSPSWSTQMTIAAGGNVGIGTTSPGAKLHVNGDVIRVVNSTWSGVEAHNTNGTWESFVGTESGGGGNRYNSASSKHTFYNNSNAVMTINSSGNVGIGVIPKTGGSTWQHIQFGGTGNIIARKSDSTVDAMFANNYYINNSNTDTHITTGAATRMFLNDGEIRFDTAPSAAAEAAAIFTNRLFITNTGNVGIGNTAPGNTFTVGDNLTYSSSFPHDSLIKNLMVRGNGSSPANLWLHKDDQTIFDTNDLGSIKFSGHNGTDSVVGGRIWYEATEDWTGSTNSTRFSVSVVDGTTSTTGLVIEPDGAIQLPQYTAGYLKSDASGNITVDTSTIEDTLDSVTDRGATTTNSISVGEITGSKSVDGDVNFRFKNTSTGTSSAGNVWIYSEAYSTIRFAKTSTDSQRGKITYDFANEAMSFRTNAVDDRLYINSSGNVGINTTNPGAKLDVIGNGRFYSAIGVNDNVRTGIAHYDTTAQVANVGGQLVLGYKYHDNGSYTEGAILKMYKLNSTSGDYSSGLKFQVRNTGDNLSTKMTLDPSGNLGIGTTGPVYKLDVVGNQRIVNTGGSETFLVETNYDRVGKFHSTDSGAFLAIQDNNSTNNGVGINVVGNTLSLKTSNSAHLYIAADGDVGIGTTNPLSTLHVSDATDISMSSGGDGQFRVEGNGYTGAIALDDTAMYLYHNSAARNLVLGTDETASITIHKSNQTLRFHAYGAGYLKSDASGNITVDSDTIEDTLQSVTDRGATTTNSISVAGVTSGNFTSGTQGFSIESGDATVTTYRFDADKFRFYSGNFGEIVSIKENGNLGLGITNPSQKLSVNGNIQGYYDLYLGADKTSGSTILQLNNYDSALTDAEDVQNVIKMQGRYWTGNNSQLIQTEIRSVKERSNGNGDSGLAFATQAGGNAPAERMRIDHDGNVGIGTTGPGAKLDVSGNIRTSTYYNFNGNPSIPTTSVAAIFDQSGVGPTISGLNVTFRTGTTPDERMRITSGGNVGINTNNPTKLLTVGSGATASGISNNGIYVAVNGGAAVTARNTTNEVEIQLNAEVSQGTLGTFTNHPLAFRVNNSNKMWIDTSGNVGINTTSPGGRLHVVGNVLVQSGRIYTDAIQGYSANSITIGDGNSTFNIISRDNEDVAITGTGNVGIGTASPATKLHVVGTAETRLRVGSSNASSNVVLELRDENTPTGQGTVITYNNSTGETYFNNALSTATTDFHFQSGEYGTANDFFTLSNSGGNAILHLKTTGGDSFITYENATNELAVASDGDLRLTTPTDQDVFFISSGGNIETTQAGGSVSMGGDLFVDGNVGIGTASPTKKLHVTGDTLIESSGGAQTLLLERTGGKPSIKAGTTEGGNLILDSSTGHIYLNNYVNKNVYMVTGGGSVGIGTTSPGAKLEVREPANTESSIRIRQLSYNYWDLKSPASDTGFAISDVGGEKLRITSAGNVGIGTTSPGSKLEVRNTDNTVVDATIATWSSNTTLTLWNLSTTNTTGNFIQYANAAGSGSRWYTGSLGGSSFNSVFVIGNRTASSTISERLRIDGSGNVGIGTDNPSYKLTVNSGTTDIGILTASSDSGSYVGFLDNSTSTIPKVGAVGNKLILDASQYVGVRRTDPSYALDVSGTIRATGDVIAYSDARVKENVETIPNALDKVKAMRGVGYNKIGEQKRSIGVIAQEMLEVMPEVVSQDEQGMYSVAYGNLVGVLVEAVKELEAKVEQLENKLNGTAS